MQQFQSRKNIIPESMEHQHFVYEDDDGYESRTSFDSLCHGKYDMHGNVCNCDSFQEVMSVAKDLQSNSYFDSDSLLSQRWQLEHQSFGEFPSSDLPDLLDVLQDIDSNCSTCDGNKDNRMKFQMNISVENKAELNDKYCPLESSESDGRMLCMELPSPSRSFPGLSKCMQNISLQICDGIITSKACVSDKFPSFTRVTDIGNMGALSCPAESGCDGVVSGTLSSIDLTTSCNKVNILETSFTKSLSQKIYRMSVLLDHDYCKLFEYPKHRSSLGANRNGSGSKMSQASFDRQKFVGLSKNRPNKSKGLSKTRKISRSQVTLPKKSESENYIMLPGRHQNDYVYFAIKRPQISRRQRRN